MFDTYNGGLLGQPGYGTSQWAAGQEPFAYQPAADQAGLNGGNVRLSGYNWGQLNPNDLKTLGWGGDVNSAFQPLQTSNDGSNGGADFVPNNLGTVGYSPDFQQFLQSKGLTSRIGQGESGFAQQFYDQGGNAVGEGQKWGLSADQDPFGVAMLAAGLGVGGGIASGAIGGGGAGAGGVTGFSGGGANVAVGDLAASPGYQAGLAAAGAPASGIPSGASWAALGGDAAITNPALIESGLGTAGYGASSAGAGGAAGGGGFMSSVGNGLKTIGDFAKENPGLINTGGALANGLIGAYSANKASNAQLGAIDRANAIMKPYTDFGYNGLAGATKLLNDPSSITQNPGYQFRLQQGQQALDRSAASRGGLYSGAQMKASQRFGQDYASNEYDKALNRYTGAAQLGVTGVQGSQANVIGGGNALAGASLYTGNAAQNALNNFLGNWNYSQYQKPGGP